MNARGFLGINQNLLLLNASIAVKETFQSASVESL
jgi:hypothetical protein